MFESGSGKMNPEVDIGGGTSERDLSLSRCQVGRVTSWSFTKLLVETS